MWKVDYYTLAVCEDGSVGNVRQYSDTWYTEYELEDLYTELQKVIDAIKGKNKYHPVVERIENIRGHGDR